MAVAFRSSSATGTSDAFVTTLNVPVPSGAAANDIALVAIEQWESANPTVTPPSGFTAITSVVSGSQKLKLWWKRLTGADTGNYTFTWTGSQWSMGHCILLTGAVTTGDPVGSNFNTATATSTSIPTTTVTTGFQPGLACFVANENAATQTPPTNYTEVQDGDYLHSSYRIPGTTGSHSASGGTLSTSTLILAALVAVEPAGSGTSLAANTASETNTALSMGEIKRKTANLATEADTAITLGRSKARSAPLAAETDSAFAFGRAKVKAVATALATEVALPIGRVKQRAIGLPAETDVGFTLGRIKVKAVGLSPEVDTAFAFGSTSGISQPMNTALETDTALSIGYVRSRPIGTAVELHVAMPLVITTSAWRLRVPLIQERHRVRGALISSLWREVTVFGDENGLFTSDQGYIAEGGDAYGAIPFGTKYIWYGGHQNLTADPAIRQLWLAHGFEVENV